MCAFARVTLSPEHNLDKAFFRRFATEDIIVASCVRQFKSLIQPVQAAAPDPAQTLVLISFASGRLFEELVLVTKLVNAGFRSIELHIVDPIYTGTVAKIKKSAFNVLSIPLDDLFGTFQAWFCGQPEPAHRPHLTVFSHKSWELLHSELEPGFPTVLVGIDVETVSAVEDYEKLAATLDAKLFFFSSNSQKANLFVSVNKYEMEKQKKLSLEVVDKDFNVAAAVQSIFS